MQKIIGLIIIMGTVYFVASSLCELTLIQCGYETTPLPEYHPQYRR
jgi:hypothetical protein